MSLENLPNTGEIFYQDYYDVIYEIVWNREEIDGKTIIDITTITREPRVWGEADQGRIENRKVFRRGVCTVLRQVIEDTDDGYEIVAEGSDQYIDYFQTTFNCAPLPSDVFKHHLDSAVSSSEEYQVTDGPRFADPSESGDADLKFVNVAADGSTSPVAGSTPFEFVDIW